YGSRPLPLGRNGNRSQSYRSPIRWSSRYFGHTRARVASHLRSAHPDVDETGTQRPTWISNAINLIATDRHLPLAARPPPTARQTLAKNCTKLDGQNVQSPSPRTLHFPHRPAPTPDTPIPRAKSRLFKSAFRRRRPVKLYLSS